MEAVKQMANLKNTDVFICTTPIKMYKYCPYEKAYSSYLWNRNSSDLTAEEKLKEVRQLICWT